MKHAPLIRVPITLLLLVGLAACDRSAPATDGAAERKATIFFQNNVAGAVDPCGCPGNPMGGFAKRHTFFTRMVADRSAAVVIDAGDLVGKEPYVRAADRPRVEKLTILAVDVLNDSATDVFVPGEGDLAVGWEFFRKQMMRAKFQVLAANLVDPLLPVPPFPGSVVLTRGGVRIGLVGVVSRTLTERTESAIKGEMRVDDPVSAAAREVAGMAGRADLVAVIAHLDRPELDALTQRVAGSAFVIGGHSQGDETHQLRGATGPPVFFSGKDGQFLGEILVVLRKPGRTFVDATGERAAHARLEQISQKLDDLSRRAGGEDLRRYFSSDAETLSSIDELEKARVVLEKELETSKTENTFAFRTTDLGGRVAQDPAIQAKVDAYKQAFGLK